MFTFTNRNATVVSDTHYDDLFLGVGKNSMFNDSLLYRNTYSEDDGGKETRLHIVLSLMFDESLSQ